IAVIFALIAVILLNIMPAPLRQTDYMIIGAVSTLVSMLVLFLVLTATTMKTPNTFFKRRLKK
ncbi:MAG: hypothetical protein ABI823_03650, partial [Bryobacteraceae bacterium]